MKKDVTITIRVPKKIKEELAKYGVKMSEVVRRALEEEIKRRKLEDLKKSAKELGELLAKIPDEEIVKSIKEARERR